MSAVVDPEVAIAFGDFRLLPGRQLLERDGEPLPLGGRALQLLIALAERPGEIVTKKELIERVWPDVVVEEGSLRFHMVALRKALGEGQGEQRYVATVPGRGYCFVASMGGRAPPPAVVPAKGSADTATIPPPLARMIGRDADVSEIAAMLDGHRLVSIVGAGGIGKTTVAVAVAHRRLATIRTAARFVEFSTLSDPSLIPNVVATTIGLRVQSEDATPIIVDHLLANPTLLVLDNCEHLVEPVARLVEDILAGAPDTVILTTSREALRIEGEHVFRLPALECPPEDIEPSAETIMDYAATRLFVERSKAHNAEFVVGRSEIPLIVDICRSLDGMALAIELAASRVELFGLVDLAEMLGGRMRLLWRGRRTAPARQLTLSATVDWSYNLLSDAERTVLDRLSVFVGACGTEALQSVLPDGDLDPMETLETIASLVDKSLISTLTTGSGHRFYLLQTTRAYLRGRVANSDDDQAVSRRHAEYFRDLLNSQAAGKAQGARGFSLFGEHLGNIRAALEWCFSDRGDRMVGAGLAAIAGWAFQEMSLLGECRKWCERALASLDPTLVGSRVEMEIQAARGLSMMFTHGNGEEVRAALTRAMELAHALDDAHYELQIIGRLITFETRTCNFATAVALARHSGTIARSLGDPTEIAMAGWMLGACLHGGGDQTAAQGHCEAAVGDAPASDRIEIQTLSSYYQLRALNGLGACLWLRGQTRRSSLALRRAADFSNKLGDPLAANINAMYAINVLLWLEQWDAADEQIEWQIPHAEKHGWAPHIAVGIGFRGALQIRRGAIEAGIANLLTCLERLRAEHHDIWLGTFLGALTEGLLAKGALDEADRAIGEAIEQIDSGRESWFTAEVLRIGARVATARGDMAAAEALLGRALAVAGRQGALAWELRAGTDLAALWQRRGDLEAGIDLLRPMYFRYENEDVTQDLRKAARLLKELGWTSPCGGGIGLPLVSTPIEL